MYAELWMFRKDLVPTHEIVGFEVEARDGKIGKIDEMTDEVDARRGGRHRPWIFGRKVVIPAGAIERIDLNEKKVHVAMTKDQIKNSPEFARPWLARRRVPTRLDAYYGEDIRRAS